MARPEWYEETLDRQIAMNAETWAALRANGVAEGAELEVDFFFDAPDEAAGRRLADFLARERDYDAQVSSSKGGLLSKRRWAVTGRTPPMPVTLPTLDEWVASMVAAGADNGGCEFDGWGAEIP